MCDIDVGAGELQTAFSHFGNHIRRLAPKTDQTCDRCKCLDILYAIECGLKALILIRNRKKNTSLLHKSLRSHKLDLLLNECGLTSFQLVSSIQINNNPARNESIPCHKFHEALRYGAKIPEKELKRLNENIDKLYKQVEVELKGR